MMKICFYSPYIPKHFGGGEKYILDCASLLSLTHQVLVAMPEPLDLQAKAKYEQFFNLDLSRITFITTPLGSQTSFWQKLLWTRQFDVLYYLTDGSLFFSLAKRNILHIQVPLLLDKSNLIEKLKLANWQVKNTNSFFTKKVIEKSWQTRIDYVHQPMVNLNELTTKKLSQKQKVILNVGRFFTHQHAKRQDVLIQLFKQLSRHSCARDWQLVLIGGVEDQAYAKELVKAAHGYKISFYHHINRGELVKWYQRASIYWHATGYQQDEAVHPEKMEHFGISTAEAMAAGCAPVVINNGGQKEILGRQLAAWLWDTDQACLDKTLQLIKSPELREKVQAEAQKRVQKFGPDQFKRTLLTMIAA